ncbi:MAG: hypothetical protein KDB80_16190, partial [Planctomycetes bacterium]|nr:hypothetical protein [Planctomycetota bacterium]
ESGDQFGRSVSLSGDTLVVGATGEESAATGVDGDQADNAAPAAGAAYVFQRVGTVWSQVAYLKGSNTESGDEFGDAVSISNGTIAIGARTEASATTMVDGDQSDDSAPGSGAVYVFTGVAGVWTQQAYLKAANAGAGDWFGFAVGVSDDTIVVGAIGEDGSATGVDGPDDDLAQNSGAAYVFVREGVTWTQQAYLKASNTEADDAFARRVGVSGDHVVVGAHNEASAASGVDGDESDNSLAQAGAAYVYERVAGVWSQQAYLKASNPGAEDFFGWWVAVSGDYVVVGAYLEDSGSSGVDGDQGDAPLTGSGSGAAYVFDLAAAVVEGSGCPNSHAAPTCTAAASATGWFTIECPTAGGDCLGGLAIVIGACAPTPIDVPPPIGCDSCGLAIAIVWASASESILIGPGLLPGFEFCAQCGCIAMPTEGLDCIHLTGATRVVVGP